MWPNGNTDDIVMALWFIKYNYKRLIPVRTLPTRMRSAGAPFFLERDLKGRGAWSGFEREKAGAR